MCDNCVFEQQVSVTVFSTSVDFTCPSQRRGMQIHLSKTVTEIVACAGGSTWLLVLVFNDTLYHTFLGPLLASKPINEGIHFSV